MLDNFYFFLVNEKDELWTGNGFSADDSLARPYKNRVVCCSVIARLSRRGIKAKYEQGEMINERRLGSLKKSIRAQDSTRFVNRCTCRVGPVVGGKVFIASEDGCPVHGYGDE